LRAISSGVERFLHTEEVAGSKPASPTNKINMLRNFLNFDLNWDVLHEFYDDRFYRNRSLYLPPHDEIQKTILDASVFFL
jgi:hypothetical protein